MNFQLWELLRRRRSKLLSNDFFWSRKVSEGCSRSKQVLYQKVLADVEETREAKQSREGGRKEDKKVQIVVNFTNLVLLSLKALITSLYIIFSRIVT
jgi:hypothetical protein